MKISGDLRIPEARGDLTARSHPRRGGQTTVWRLAPKTALCPPGPPGLPGPLPENSTIAHVSTIVRFMHSRSCGREATGPNCPAAVRLQDPTVRLPWGCQARQAGTHHPIANLLRKTRPLSGGWACRQKGPNTGSGIKGLTTRGTKRGARRCTRARASRSYCTALDPLV